MKSGRVTAVLGPTNTGKTQYAIERMLGHRTGMIGLPLRLLAREVYDKVRKARGPSSVALVTGEERIIPKQPRYWVCTVESMPHAIHTEFLAVDEIQLCGDAERGHVFTNRLLSARGLSETLFLGSETMTGIIGKLVPKIEFRRRSRFSNLNYSGFKRISRIRPRSAIVGFSVEDVYAIAEAVRQKRGGAAVVLGALSPRTRNAQVELYQSGDVEVLVATDAIGMGLNLDIDHVAFSGLTKFDGRRTRSLFPHEIGQIAGRAGRYQRPGTFGVTGVAEPLEAETVLAVETGRFAPLRKLQWRNSDLDFRSPYTLLAALTAPSENPLLARAREADDIIALRGIIDNANIQNRLLSKQDMKLLWDVCQIPDFRKVSPGAHLELLQKIFEFLQDSGEIPSDWLETQIQRIDRVDGGVDILSRRIAFVRTWTYVSQKVDWIVDSSYWRDRTRSVEDRISDALHAGLTHRFVDQRVSVLMKQLKRKDSLVANVDGQGLLTVEGERIGRVEGFRFVLDETASVEEAKTLKLASNKALEVEFTLRANQFSTAFDREIAISEQGGLMWGEFAVGKIIAGHDKLMPNIEIFVDDAIGQDNRDKVERRLRAFVNQKITTHLGPLLQLRDDEKITGLSRGVAFRLVESFGVLPRRQIAKEIKALDQDARAPLRNHGVRFGQYSIFLNSALKPEATALRLLLWSLSENMDVVPSAPPPGRVTVPSDPSVPELYYPISGLYRVNDRAIRVDMLERLVFILRQQDSRTGFEANPDMLSLTGLSLEDFADLMRGLGYEAEQGERIKAAKAGSDTEAKKSTAPAEDVQTAAAQGAGNDSISQEKADPPLEHLARSAPEAAHSPAVVSEASIANAAVSTETDPERTTQIFYRFTWRPKSRRRPVYRQRTSDRSETSSKDPLSPKRKKPASNFRRPSAHKGRNSGPRKVEKGKAANRPNKGKRREKPMDPNNPFAVLASLKDQLNS